MAPPCYNSRKLVLLNKIRGWGEEKATQLGTPNLAVPSFGVKIDTVFWGGFHSHAGSPYPLVN